MGAVKKQRQKARGKVSEIETGEGGKNQSQRDTERERERWEERHKQR